MAFTKVRHPQHSRNLLQKAENLTTALDANKGVNQLTLSAIRSLDTEFNLGMQQLYKLQEQLTPELQNLVNDEYKTSGAQTLSDMLVNNKLSSLKSIKMLWLNNKII